MAEKHDGDCNESVLEIATGTKLSDKEEVISKNLTDKQRARIEKNRQRAVLLRQTRYDPQLVFNTAMPSTASKGFGLYIYVAIWC